MQYIARRESQGMMFAIEISAGLSRPSQNFKDHAHSATPWGLNFDTSELLRAGTDPG